MDDEHVWKLAIGTLAAGVLVTFLEAVVPAFETPTGFFAFLGAILGFAGAAVAYRHKNGNGAH